MANLIYSTIMSLDGYVADEDGNFDWAAPGGRSAPESHLFFAPIVVGGGRRSLPRNVRLELELLDERRFEGGVVHLHYSIRTRADRHT